MGGPVSDKRRCEAVSAVFKDPCEEKAIFYLFYACSQCGPKPPTEVCGFHGGLATHATGFCMNCDDATVSVATTLIDEKERG
jgi:hypothetical protein